MVARLTMDMHLALQAAMEPLVAAHRVTAMATHALAVLGSWGKAELAEIKAANTILVAAVALAALAPAGLVQPMVASA